MSDTAFPPFGTGRFVPLLPVAIDVEKDGDVFVATSQMVKGLVVVSKDRGKLAELVWEAMDDLANAAPAPVSHG